MYSLLLWKRKFFVHSFFISKKKKKKKKDFYEEKKMILHSLLDTCNFSFFFFPHLTILFFVVHFLGFIFLSFFCPLTIINFFFFRMDEI
jgi:uncharacterized membrane protein